MVSGLQWAWECSDKTARGLGVNQWFIVRRNPVAVLIPDAFGNN